MGSIRLRFSRWLIRKVLGRQMVYVTYIALHNAYMEAQLLGSTIRRDFIEEIMKYFDDDLQDVNGKDVSSTGV